MTLTRQKARLFSGIVLIVVAVIGWNTFDNQNNQYTQNTIKENSDIDFFIIKARFKSFNNHGSLSQVAHAEKVEHYQQQMKSDLVLPNISNFDKSNLTSNINSETATVQDVSSKMTFSGNVLATSIKTSKDKTFLKTEFLQYLKSENTLSTHTDVEFTDTFGNITTATGIHADIDLGHMKLLSNVKGVLNEKQNSIE